MIHPTLYELEVGHCRLAARIGRGWAGLRAAAGLRLPGQWAGRRRRRRRRERKEEEEKRRTRNELQSAKEREASEGTERRKDGRRNVYSVAVAIAAARIFNPVVIATWAAMTRKTK